MAGERRINFGADATDARYRMEDTGNGANFVIAEDLDGGTVLLEYDDSRSPSEWVVRGPVDLDGNDLSAGAIDATSVSTDEQTITDSSTVAYLSTDQTVETDTSVTVNLDQRGISDFSLSNNRVVIPSDGKYLVSAQAQFRNLSSGTEARVRVAVNGNLRSRSIKYPNGNFPIFGPTPTVLNLSENDEVSAEVLHKQGSDADIGSGEETTFLLVSRVG